MKFQILFLSLLALGLQTGCVTGQRVLSVPVPTTTAAAVTKGSVYISTVTDNRHFENKPSDPSTPSIDGDVNSLTPGKKDQMIGRQRNTFGKAMGDIALAGNDTVTGRVKSLVEEGLRRKGYEISNDPNAPTSLAVSVDEFWAWMTPGFFALTFEANVSTSLTLKDSRGIARITIKAHGLNHGQVAKNGNFIEAFEPAIDQYLTEFGTELDRAALTLAEPASAGSLPHDLYVELKRLDALRKDKLLTDEEFEAQKKKLLEKQ
jgi:uncharacterized lipoprotein YajG